MTEEEYYQLAKPQVQPSSLPVLDIDVDCLSREALQRVFDCFRSTHEVSSNSLAEALHGSAGWYNFGGTLLRAIEEGRVRIHSRGLQTEVTFLDEFREKALQILADEPPNEQPHVSRAAQQYAEKS